MADVTPTRGALLELVDERRAMREGHGFLDEKCLLLAGAMLQELARHHGYLRAVEDLHAAALAALAAAVARHGLDALQAYPATAAHDARVTVAARGLMGVTLRQAALALPVAARPDVPFDRSPEIDACREAFRALAEAGAALAASHGNLERLEREYHRASRRARALADVLLPEADRRIAELDTRLAELEQEDAIWRRPRG